ncbi:MAG: DinB family protein, partial [Caldilineaceae bacterium]
MSDAESTGAAAPPTGPALAAELRSSFERLLWAVDLLEPGECERTTMDGAWSPKALLAHVAFWDDVQRERIEVALAGDSAGNWRPRESNDMRAEVDVARPLAEVFADAETARARLAAFAEAQSPETLARDLPEGDRTLRPGVLLTHMVEHTERHRRDLFSWCGSMARWNRADLRTRIDRLHTLMLESVAGLTEAQ